MLRSAACPARALSRRPTSSTTCAAHATTKPPTAGATARAPACWAVSSAPRPTRSAGRARRSSTPTTPATARSRPPTPTAARWSTSAPTAARCTPSTAPSRWPAARLAPTADASCLPTCPASSTATARPPPRTAWLRWATRTTRTASTSMPRRWSSTSISAAPSAPPAACPTGARCWSAGSARAGAAITRSTSPTPTPGSARRRSPRVCCGSSPTRAWASATATPAWSRPASTAGSCC